MESKLFNQKRLTLMDGAMGTMLQARGLPPGGRPDLYSVTHPEVVTSIHRDYVKAGADLICTNTFGTNAHKLAGSGYSVKDIVQAAVACAQKACQGSVARILLDIGPIGEMLVPGGTLGFEEAYNLFKEIMVAGEKAGVDAVLLETMTDLYEVKAGVLAAKENTALPVLASMTFEQNGRTFTGCSIESMVATLEGLGVDGLGINCSLGPAEVLPLATSMCERTNLPVFVKANAGLPDPETGIYSVSAEQFCREMEAYQFLGLTAMGGCCGTTPEYTARMKQAFQGVDTRRRKTVRKSVICSAVTCVTVDQVTVIGENINPTGKKRLKAALRNRDIDYILEQALLQEKAGAQVLDVNVGLPDIDEEAMMVSVVQGIQSVSNLPLQIDSTRAEVLEAGLRVYNGKPIVNSVNAEEAVLDRLLPICKKYGAAVVGLTLDEKGIPARAEERFHLAEKIVAAAKKHGIPKEDVYIDCLTLTASAQQKEVQETLKALQMVKERLGVKTVLGVSNVSYGLPFREQINTTFLTLALAHGLDLPIINPNSEPMMGAIASFNVLYNHDPQAREYLGRYAGTLAPAASPDVEMSLGEAVIQGLQTPAAGAVKKALKTMAPEDIVNGLLIPALDTVGERYEKGICYLPQLLQSANAAVAAFDVLKQHIAETGLAEVGKGKVLLATVKGDIHDIGKNIVKTILANYGYQVMDLGRDVPPEKVVEAVQEHQIELVGLSALMTTTLGAMKDTIEGLKAAGLTCQVMVGGAVLTQEYAIAIGAHYYAKDAKAAVDIAKKVFE